MSNSSSSSASQIRDLREPEFNRFFDDTGRHLLRQVRDFAVVRNAAGEVNFSIFPAAFNAVRYDSTNDILQSTLEVAYRPTRLAVAADVTAGLTKDSGSGQVAVAIGDIIVDNSEKVSPVRARRRKTKTILVGIYQSISQQTLAELKFNAESPLLRQMETTLRYAMESVIISALYGFSLRDDGTAYVPGLGEYFTNPDGQTVQGTTTKVGYSDYSGTSVVTGSNSVERGLLGDSLPSREINVFGFIDIARARARIIHAGKLTTNAKVFMIIHPRAYSRLIADTAFVSGLSKTSSSLLETGFVPEIAGATVLVTPHCALDIITVFSANAIGVAFNGGVDSGMELKLQEANAVKIGAWMNLGAAVLREEEIFHIRYRTS